MDDARGSGYLRSGGRYRASIAPARRRDYDVARRGAMKKKRRLRGMLGQVASFIGKGVAHMNKKTMARSTPISGVVCNKDKEDKKSMTLEELKKEAPGVGGKHHAGRRNEGVQQSAPAKALDDICDEIEPGHHRRGEIRRKRR